MVFKTNSFYSIHNNTFKKLKEQDKDVNFTDNFVTLLEIEQTAITPKLHSNHRPFYHVKSTK